MKMTSGGTSPRARGKLGVLGGLVSAGRNIPACAGKTCAAAPSPQPDAEHPRVRGENSGMAGFPTLTEGTSPRARGKRSFQSISPLMMRNIPACAGKTASVLMPIFSWKEHPRVRGENSNASKRAAPQLGTSPRARGKLATGGVVIYPTRNIPACAGKTSVTPSPTPQTAGTSPRARGKLMWAE